MMPSSRLVPILLIGFVGAPIGPHPTPLRSTGSEHAEEAPGVQPYKEANGTGQRDPYRQQQANEAAQREAAIEDGHSVHPEGKRSRDPDQSPDKASEYWAIVGHRLKITDTLLAAFTFALCLIGWWQGRQLKRTVAHMEGANETQLRAYVHQQIVGWRGINNGRALGLHLAPVNKGQTPARNAWNVGTIKILPFPLPADFDFPLPTTPVTQRVAVWPSESNGSKGWIVADCPFSASELEEITTVDAKRRAWAYGILTYEDIFGKERHTRYCWFLDPASIQYKVGLNNARQIDTWVWGAHDRHTDFD
jgi:hypothetical protein